MKNNENLLNKESRNQGSMTRRLINSRSQNDIISSINSMSKVTNNNNSSNNLKYKNRSGFSGIKQNLPKLIKFHKISDSLNNINTSNILKYTQKKRDLSFYNGFNISSSLLLLDQNKTYSTDFKSNCENMNNNCFNINSMKKTCINFNNKILKKNLKNSKEKKLKNEPKNLIEENFVEKNNKKIFEPEKMLHEPSITIARNKFSILFNHEFENFNKFIPSIYTLKFDKETKYNLFLYHDKISDSLNFITDTFLDQDIENFKITVKNLEKILRNFLDFFIYYNKIIANLIEKTKEYSTALNKQYQNKKIVTDDKDTKIINLEKKIFIKDSQIKNIKNENFVEKNNFLLTMYKMKEEQSNLIKLLDKTKNYYNKYVDSQKEIKEKNNQIIQQRIDLNCVISKKDYNIMRLEEDLNNLKEEYEPLKIENEQIAKKNSEISGKLDIFKNNKENIDEIIRKCNENLMMKDEEILSYVSEIRKLKMKNEKLTYSLVSVRNKISSFNRKNDFGIEMLYNGKIGD